MDSYTSVIKKYAVFTGRATRKEYWMFILVNLGISVILAIIDNMLNLHIGMFGILGLIYSLAVLVPGLAVAVRRLHDTGRSGWWLLIALIPLIGGIVLLLFMCIDSEPGENMYGPNPKGIQKSDTSTSEPEVSK